MPRLVALLFLFLAVSGQPLRRAEAASDLARALAHSLIANDAIEAPDGGVGDDSGETLTNGAANHAAAGCLPSGDLWASTLGDFPTFVLAGNSPGFGPSRGPSRHAAWLPVAAGRRQAWLQLLQV